jgi:uncharacterized spore protein YtfJ
MASKLEQDISAAIEAATRAGAGGPGDEFLGRLAERIGAQANVKAVFGQPIERDGLIVVPVAKVRWGFGGGAGSGPTPTGSATAEGVAAASDGSGEGGGGAATADPIGWLEINAQGAEFKPIVPAMPSPAFIFASTFGASLVLRALAKLARR